MEEKLEKLINGGEEITIEGIDVSGVLYQHVSVEPANDPKLEHHCGLTPKELPDLVENDPSIAAEVLTKLVNLPEMAEYFTVLENMEITLQSMDKLATTIDLPIGFLPTYVANCIKACLAIKDRHKQKRLVRLVFVFLQCLIENKTINVHDIFMDAQIFCIEFSYIKEAADLFRLLQSLK
ncbi:hypothetical protein CASFOL_000917 [Castilleja foliolosa]|uniref:CCR4-NOT transcription complex subunit 11 n=1 Tax=Castilleja foliolosa TaxID=1961234 RepID=A0ABD3ELL7_9LAMI